MKRISIIFLLMLALVITAGCNNNSAPPADTTTSTPDTTTEAAPTGITLYENGATQFRVVFPSKVADEEFDAYLKIADAFKKLGITIKNARDTEDETEFEILIGETIRPESMETVASLRDNDYVIKAAGSRIVIVGGSPKATFAAAQKFIEQHLTGTAATALMEQDMLISYSDTYDVKSLSINSIPITSFTIVRPAASSKLEIYAAKYLQEVLTERVNVTLDVTTDKSTAEYEILIGATARSGDKCEDFTNVTYADGNSIIINGDVHSIVKAVNEFVKNIPEKSDKDVNITVGSERTVISTAETPYPAEQTLDGRRVVALADQLNASFVLIDLDAPDPTAPEAVIWEWKPTPALGFKQIGKTYANRIDEAIIRYSDVLGCYVICVTSSSGYMCVAKYPSGECVWEATASGYGPHSIDYLPDGNVVVACSGNSDTQKGCIRIYSTTSDKYSNYNLVSAHGVLWDDESQLLWALGSSELRAYRVGGTADNPKLIRAEGLGTTSGISGGHNLSVCSADTDYLWISGSKVWLFQKSTGKVVSNYNGSDKISRGSVKSVDSFEDGTVIQAIATGVYASHNTDTLVVTTFDDAGNATTQNLVFAGRAFYKARRADAQYS